ERTFADELREEYGDIETATLDILPDLERKRDRLNAMAEDHKNKRDRLNGVTKSLAMERDSFNAQVRELVQTANDNRNNRNKLNSEVKEAKVLRDDLNKKAAEFNEVVTKLKRERQGETGGPNLNRLRNERKALEFKAMTQVLSVDKEKELMASIQRINQQIEEQEKKMEENREIRTALKDSREAKEAAEHQHRLVSDLARQAQTSHDTMIELYEKADDIRKKADDCQGRFIENKQTADAEHKAHIDLIRKVHDYDKFISGLRRRDRRVRKDRQEKAQKKVAEDMMDRFKKGEKLSTEDLLSLQTERY
ncbi:MAG: phosphoserine phosphatase, partial [Thermoplasmata archaeon]|nr:phosphoserine phosphatase [Thermoplasmata archaeon]